MANRWIIAVIALAMLASFCGLYVHREARVADFYAQALRDARSIERVSNGNLIYVVTNGEVFLDDTRVRGFEAYTPLRIAYAKTLARRAPLMAMPGISLEEYGIAFAALAHTQEALANEQESVRDRQLIHGGLYPLRFLETARTLENARRDFLNAGSRETLGRYQIFEKQTIAAYKADLQRFRTAFEAAVPGDAPDFATKKNIVSRRNTLAALDVLRDEIRETEGRSFARSVCIRGNTRACDNSLLRLPQITAPQREADIVAARSSIDTLELAGVSFDALPLVVLSTSACIKGGKSPLVYAFEDLQRVGRSTSYSNPTYVGDVSLINISQYGDFPFFSYFHSRGALHVPLRELTYYACPETDFDQGGIMAIMHVRDLVSSLDVDVLFTEEEAGQLRELEQRLKNPSVIRETDAIRYLTASLEILGRTDETADMQAKLSEAWLGMHTRSGGVLQVMKDITTYEQTDLYLARQGITFDFSVRYLFYVRSAFAPLFMASNPTVIQSHPPFFDKNALPEKVQPFRSFSALSESEQARAIADMALYFAAHKEGVQN